MKGEVRPALSYGWCMTSDHDTPEGRGGCPIQVGAQRPCGCPCHDGATEPRGLLPVKPLAPADERLSDSPVGPEVEAGAEEPQEALPGVRKEGLVGGPVVGEQIPLL